MVDHRVPHSVGTSFVHTSEESPPNFVSSLRRTCCCVVNSPYLFNSSAASLSPKSADQSGLQWTKTGKEFLSEAVSS